MNTTTTIIAPPSTITGIIDLESQLFAMLVDDCYSSRTFPEIFKNFKTVVCAAATCKNSFQICEEYCIKNFYMRPKNLFFEYYVTQCAAGQFLPWPTRTYRNDSLYLEFGNDLTLEDFEAVSCAPFSIEVTDANGQSHTTTLRNRIGLGNLITELDKSMSDRVKRIFELFDAIIAQDIDNFNPDDSQLLFFAVCFGYYPSLLNLLRPFVGSNSITVGKLKQFLTTIRLAEEKVLREAKNSIESAQLKIDYQADENDLVNNGTILWKVATYGEPKLDDRLSRNLISMMEGKPINWGYRIAVCLLIYFMGFFMAITEQMSSRVLLSSIIAILFTWHAI